MFLTVYLENVLPSEFGVRKNWYYIFLPSTYFKSMVTKKYDVLDETVGDDRIGMNEILQSSDAEDEGASAQGFEQGPSYSRVGVDVQNLRKDFGSHKVAVDGVSMKMYEGEIFALLGHNGAGKTTTISMLTGMFAPSGGTAFVNGYDITSDLDRARDNLGLCPQHNMLFDKLTVSEHLRFFGQVLTYIHTRYLIVSVFIKFSICFL